MAGEAVCAINLCEWLLSQDHPMDKKAGIAV